MTDEEFAEFCSKYPDYFIEMTAEGEILIMPPTFSLTGARNTKILTQLGNWTNEDGRGIATESSTGFLLPNRARRSPDAAWTRRERILALDMRSLEGYFHLCPDFVIELRSKSDRLPVLRRIMREWIDNGAQLAWLIDPERKAIEVYRPGNEIEMHIDIDSIAAPAPVDGFALDLRPVWNPLA